MSKQDRAREWVNNYAITGTAIVVAAIVPGTNAVALIAIEATMCFHIGRIYRGDDFSMKEAGGIAASVGLAAVAGQIIALEALTLIPWAGWAAKGAIAGGIIKTLGEAIISYYENKDAQFSSTSTFTATFNPQIIEIVEIKPPNQIITLIGATSAGKSSTANALLGYEAFPVGAEHGTTIKVNQKDYTQGYSLRDTPGLMDDTNFKDVIWETLQDSELVIYVTGEGQLYRPELDIVKRIRESQIQWDQDSQTIGHRQLAVYVNREDVKQLTMTSQTIQQEANLIRNQVSQWIPSHKVVFGASSPIAKGIRQTPRIEALESLINSHINNRK
ncbi:MAG TPA: GTP-binding protein HSR1 [Planktothrix sp. UBA10369]|nr:GTP-binding protein HSR1 [Planktothrix sp. UBA10369]